MGIVKNETIRKKYCAGFDRDALPDEIVIHATAGRGTLKWMENGGDLGNGKSRSEDYKKGVGLFHYLIESAGQIVEVIDPDKWVYHSSSGTHDKKTIGIEISKAKSDNSDEPTLAQYVALEELITILKRRYKISGIVSHDENAKKFSNRPPKPCPGAIDWSRVLA